MTDKAGVTTVDTTGGAIYETEKGCTAIIIGCTAGSTQVALVNVPSLHGDAYMQIDKGVYLEFRAQQPNGIRKVNAKGSTGNATISFGPCE